MTFKELFRSSLRMIGQLRVGQTYNASQLTDGLLTCNSMLEAWLTERLNAYRIARDVYALTGAASYTIGIHPNGSPVADFNAARPTRIERAAKLYAGGDVEIPLDLLNEDGWSDYLNGLYDDYGYPFSMLRLRPAPNAGESLVLYTWQQFTAFESAEDDVLFPPGYAEAIRCDLAVRLAPEYGVAVPPEVAAMAATAKANIKRLNAPALEMSCDSALLGDRRGFNFVTGE